MTDSDPQVATAIRGAIIMAKLSIVPVRRGFWGTKLGKPHTVPCKVETPAPTAAPITHITTLPPSPPLPSSSPGDRQVWQYLGSSDPGPQRYRHRVCSGPQETAPGQAWLELEL